MKQLRALGFVRGLVNGVKHHVLLAHELAASDEILVPLDRRPVFGEEVVVQRLNWMSDTSTAGLRRSYGMTVNYVDRLTDLERNHDAYANQCRVASSRAFQRITRPRR